MNLLARLVQRIGENLVTDAGRPLAVAFPAPRSVSPDEVISGHLHDAWPCCSACCPATGPCPVFHRAPCDCRAGDVA